MPRSKNEETLRQGGLDTLVEQSLALPREDEMGTWAAKT